MFPTITSLHDRIDNSQLESNVGGIMLENHVSWNAILSRINFFYTFSDSNYDSDGKSPT